MTPERWISAGGHQSAHAGQRRTGSVWTTTVGRVLLAGDPALRRFPSPLSIKVLNKKELANLIDQCYRFAGNKKTVILADQLKDLGYRYATQAGISICIDDMVIPSRKKAELLEKANQEVLEIENQYKEGLITDGERYNKVVDIWAQVTENIGFEILDELGTMIDHRSRRERKNGFPPSTRSL